MLILNKTNCSQKFLGFKQQIFSIYVNFKQIFENFVSETLSITVKTLK